MSLRRSKHFAGAGAIVSFGLAALVANLLPPQVYGEVGAVKMAVLFVLTVFFLLVDYCVRLLRQSRENKREPPERLERKLEP